MYHVCCDLAVVIDSVGVTCYGAFQDFDVSDHSVCRIAGSVCCDRISANLRVHVGVPLLPRCPLLGMVDGVVPVGVSRDLSVVVVAMVIVIDVAVGILTACVGILICVVMSLEIKIVPSCYAYCDHP